MAALGMLRSVSACPLYSLEVRFTLITIGTVCGKEDSIDIKDSGVLVWVWGCVRVYTCVRTSKDIRAAETKPVFRMLPEWKT